ncbi:uncharacterized protein LOC132192662 isoform X2 [Neocloeon triangulifer]|uniref:uncharacterized protein LOC132192662 isoform X2 n=1 Tax=Neocloeon triangulifer TaxID=2078957 RepID=UPI00286F6306|nr:uncharacterized protein LOC132192662 isoform X2 [Neocloeon triangulifer]
MAPFPWAVLTWFATQMALTLGMAELESCLATPGLACPVFTGIAKRCLPDMDNCPKFTCHCESTNETLDANFFLLHGTCNYEFFDGSTGELLCPAKVIPLIPENPEPNCPQKFISQSQVAEQQTTAAVVASVASVFDTILIGIAIILLLTTRSDKFQTEGTKPTGGPADMEPLCKMEKIDIEKIQNVYQVTSVGPEVPPPNKDNNNGLYEVPIKNDA